MELPQGIETVKGNSKDYVLKLLKNIYGQKQAGRVWNSFLVEKLTSIGFQPSLIDDCVFFRDDVIFMVYVDDGIFIGNDDEKLKEAIREMQALGLNIEDQGHPADYVGVNIRSNRDGTYEFTLVNDSNYVASELDACPPLVIAPAPPGDVGLGLFPITVGAGLVLIVTGAVLIPVLVAQRKRRSS